LDYAELTLTVALSKITVKVNRLYRDLRDFHNYLTTMEFPHCAPMAGSILKIKVISHFRVKRMDPFYGFVFFSQAEFIIQHSCVTD